MFRSVFGMFEECNLAAEGSLVDCKEEAVRLVGFRVEEGIQAFGSLVAVVAGILAVEGSVVEVDNPDMLEVNILVADILEEGDMLVAAEAGILAVLDLVLELEVSY